MADVVSALRLLLGHFCGVGAREAVPLAPGVALEQAKQTDSWADLDRMLGGRVDALLSVHPEFVLRHMRHPLLRDELADVIRAHDDITCAPCPCITGAELSMIYRRLWDLRVDERAPPGDFAAALEASAHRDDDVAFVVRLMVRAMHPDVLRPVPGCDPVPAVPPLRQEY